MENCVASGASLKRKHEDDESSQDEKRARLDPGTAKDSKESRLLFVLVPIKVPEARKSLGIRDKGNDFTICSYQYVVNSSDPKMDLENELAELFSNHSAYDDESLDNMTALPLLLLHFDEDGCVKRLPESIANVAKVTDDEFNLISSPRGRAAHGTWTSWDEESGEPALFADGPYAEVYLVVCDLAVVYARAEREGLDKE